MFHVKSGNLNITIPGALIVKIVVIKLTEPRIVPSPLMANPIIQRSAPIVGELTALESGA